MHGTIDENSERERGTPSSVTVIGLAERRRTLVEQAAASLGFKGAVRTVDSEAMLPLEARDADLLVAETLEAATAERLGAAVDAGGLPRWAIVSFAANVPEPAVWHAGSSADPAPLAVVFRRALAVHALRRTAARARGDLLTIARRISHEMRSPLGCILTSVDMIVEEAGNPEGQAGTHALAEPIIESAKEVIELLDRLTLIARATADPLVPAEVDMGLAVWAARERLGSKIASVGAEISEPADWPAVWGKREWLESIWQNLIANGLLHAGPRPKITLGWEQRQGTARFFVRDTGEGVPPEIRDRLFRPFHRLHERDSGRGLGLPMVQRLVELQGGTCGYSPISPRGSEFYFTLPIAAVS